MNLSVLREVAELELDPEIAPTDDMFRQGEESHYFGVCRSALRNIALCLVAAEKTEVRSILDLPCGHGRVLRGLRAMFPAAKLAACDLQTQGVDFCARRFGAAPIYSSKDPKQIPLREQFDLIWVGSLFTHLDSGAWRDFLSVFSRSLADNGVLVFTTHGRNAARHLARQDKTYGLHRSQLPKLEAAYHREGFGFQEQEGTPGYGVSVSAPHWIFRLIESHPELKVVYFKELAWDNHHDVVGVVKTQDSFDVPHALPAWRRKLEEVVPESLLNRARKVRAILEDRARR